jgi:Tol biopolymer transport system component
MLLWGACSLQAASFNAFGLEWYVTETQHFRVTYHKGIEKTAKEIGDILEDLHDIFAGKYRILLPARTEVVVAYETVPNGFAYPTANLIKYIIPGPDWLDRCSSDWLENVVTHEYAHVVSIWISRRLPAWMPYAQAGYFSHPNNTIDSTGPGMRFEVHRVLPQDILPPWFTEGIAQYESSKHGADRWGANRDMILRTLILSDKLLSWDEMSVFRGRGDSFEQVYNHGFALVTYIAETYGEDKLEAILREASKPFRFTFDRGIEEVLGITGRQLYAEWKKHLAQRYTAQLDSLGEQVYGRKINKHGFNNVFPRFSPGDDKIFFQSNGKSDSYRTRFMSYTLADTVDDDERVKPEALGVRGRYDIHDSSGYVTFVSSKSRKSLTPPSQGGARLPDIFIDTLPKAEKEFGDLFRTTERQVTERHNIHVVAFSPTGDRLAAARHTLADRSYLMLVDTAGEEPRRVYPPDDDTTHRIRRIFSIDWSPDGRRIAMAFLDRGHNKIGIYDTLEQRFTIVCDTEHDERDPRFGPAGRYLYFSSDRTGIFNIYRYALADGRLERVTNVSGGAFMPDINGDGTKLVYTNYDDDGYGIYLIDSLTPLQLVDSTPALTPHDTVPPVRHDIAFSPPREYKRLPHKLWLIPSLFAEQLVTENDNVFEGKTALKAGGTFFMFEPLALDGIGNEFGGYLLLEPHKIGDFINLKQGGFGANVNYDMGAFARSGALPLTVSFDMNMRGIAGEDEVYFEEFERLYTMPYGITLKDMNLILTHGVGTDPMNPSAGLQLHAMGSLNSYRVYLDASKFPFPYNHGDLRYHPARGNRLSLFSTLLDMPYTATSAISPKGWYVKLKYDFWNQKLMKEEHGITMEEGGAIKVNYDQYRFHEMRASIKHGRRTPWYRKHDLYMEYDVSGIRLTRSTMEHLRDKNMPQHLPSFFQPIAWVPGYAYLFRDTLHKANGADSLAYDTVLVSGDLVMQGQLSYRFPLWRPIEKKLGWIFLDHLYGAVNVSAGAGWNEPKAFLDPDRDDWLVSVGGEVRLEALSFSNYPLYIKFRFDKGLDRPPPVGGWHLALSVGMSFDNWGYITVPDFHHPRRGIGRRAVR